MIETILMILEYLKNNNIKYEKHIDIPEPDRKLGIGKPGYYGLYECFKESQGAPARIENETIIYFGEIAILLHQALFCGYKLLPDSNYVCSEP
jgi:hypothetical protein